MKILKDKFETGLLLKAGEALVDTYTYLMCDPSTQPYDYDKINSYLKIVKEVIREIHTEEKINSYLEVLRKYNLDEDFKELKDNYEKLKEITNRSSSVR